MSQKAGAISDLMSVPKGGGAQKGLGEKFSADLHTGTGNFSVPIAVPPGRNGLQPQLSLGFSTGSGNSPFGLGWALSIPGISRLTSKGIPRYRDGTSDQSDTFVLSGAEDLVEMESSATDRGTGVRRFRPRTEGLFAQISHHSQGTDHWEVRTKDGLTSVYGTPGAVPVRLEDDSRAVVADPAVRSKVFAWRLTETRDPFGNRIVYDYIRDNATDRGHDGEQLYLRRIRYVDYGDSADVFLVSVEFLYDDDFDAPAITPEFAKRTRPDPFSDYRAGFEIRTRRRCKWVVIRTHPAPDKALLVRSYELIYLDEQSPDAALLPINGASLLSRINVVGYPDGDEVQGLRELPPLDFEYSRFTPESRKFIAVEGRALPVSSLSNPDLELVDLFGRGLPDILELSGTARYWRNLGNGRFDLPRQFAEVPATWRLSDAGVQMLDANGDGRADLLVTTGDGAGYWPLDFRGQFSRRSYQPYREAPSFNLEDPEVRLVDLTGDGVTDVLRSGTSFECFFNHPTEGWSSKRTARIPREGLETFPNVSFADPRVKFADLSGDGLQDIAVVYQGRIDYWPNLGYGHWGKRIVTQIPGMLPPDFDPQRVLLGDVDGDGIADLLYVSDRGVTLWVNRTGNGWSEPRTIRGTPAVNNEVSVRLVDLLGAGVAGVLWTRDADGSGRPANFFLDLTGGRKPYLLDRMDNHLGAITKVSYSPSTQYYLRDQATPATRWRTTLPFPVQVAEQVAVSDELSGGTLTTEYRYHHGYWDGVEREFRGFGMVEQLDTEVFSGYVGRGLKGDDAALARLLAQQSYSPPLLTRTWFHQGPVDAVEAGPWREFDGAAEQWPGDPNLLDHRVGIDKFLKSLGETSTRAKRDAMRALRGSVLRTELYALDGSPLQDRPYTVTEQAYGLREEPAVPGTARVFFPFSVASRNTQWERGDDPMTQLSFTSDHDDFGQPLRQLSVACPRGWRTLADRPSSPFLATLTTTTFAKPAADGSYIHDRVARSRNYEVTETTGESIKVLMSVAEGDAHPKRLIAEAITYFDGDPFVGTKEFGELGSFGAAARSESLVLTEAILKLAYSGERPGYLDPTSPFSGGGDYPPAFVASVPVLAGYVFHDGAGHSPYAGGWYSQTSRTRFDFHDPVATIKPRGLVLAQLDPLGNETRIDNYLHDFLPTQATGPTGLTTKADYNLRVMQPERVFDPNSNVIEVKFSPNGLVTETFARGKPGAAADDRRNRGDVEQPCVRMEYGLRAFYDSKRADPVNPKPAFVRAVRRVDHDGDTLATADAIEARQYSDGFGRLLQTRTQGESLRFGDARFGGGNAVLPLDQNAASTLAIMGAENTDLDTPNVVVSGWQRYDNKGRAVEKFEPFFDTGWLYRPSADPPIGQSVKVFYDARGQAVRSINPDRSEQIVVRGVPVDLSDPPLSPLDIAKFKPTPWEAYTYDANDNAGRTHPNEKPHSCYPHHCNTPASVEVDSLGRTIRAVARHRDPPMRDDAAALPPIEEHVTRSTYDVQGNLLATRDALGRLAFEYVYDLAKHPLRTESIDAGYKQSVVNAAGNPLETRDAKRSLVLHAYDKLNRPTYFWARDAAGGDATLRERIIYDGDPAIPQDAADRNLLGHVFQHHDEAGVVTIAECDFKGNVLRSSRQVLSDEFLLSNVKSHVDGADWNLQAPRVDWANPPAKLLDARAYVTQSAYDALGRVKWSESPECANGERYRLRPSYNRAGFLEQMDLEGPLSARGVGDVEPYVRRIAYNASGQRTLIVFGNDLLTRYAYDPATFRLARLRTDRLDPDPGPNTYQPQLRPLQGQGAPLQDIAYGYDLVGNILSMLDRTPGCGVRNNPDVISTRGPLRLLLSQGDALLRCFDYDPLYRLTSATGREGMGLDGKPRPWGDARRDGYDSGNHGTANQGNAPFETSLYWEEYEYDAAGNMLALRHSQSVQRDGAVGWNVAWSRRFGMGLMDPTRWRFESAGHLTRDWDGGPSNRLTHVQVRASGEPTADSVPQSHFYDDGGNMIKENNERHFEWDHSNRIKVFRNQIDASRPTVYALYLYDAGGRRVKKLIITGAGYRTTNYLGLTFEHDIEFGTLEGAARAENCTLYVMDGMKRVAAKRVGEAFEDDMTGEHFVKYYHEDHLGTVVLVVSVEGDWINREEFFPYGETSFGGFSRKRYRYCGRERDIESGCEFHGARYYSPSAARWISTDPIGPADGANLYFFSKDSPVRFADKSGFATPGEDSEPNTVQSNDIPSGGDYRDADNLLGPFRQFFGIAEADRATQNALLSDEGAEALSEARQKRAKGVTAVGELLDTTGELVNAATPGPHAQPDAISTKAIDAISEKLSAIKNAAKRLFSSLVEAGEEAKTSVLRLLGGEVEEIAGRGLPAGGIFNDELSQTNCVKTVSAALASMNDDGIIAASKFETEANEGFIALSNSYIERKAGVQLGRGVAIVGDESRYINKLEDGFYVVYEGLERQQTHGDTASHVLLGAVTTDSNGSKYLQLFDAQSGTSVPVTGEPIKVFQVQRFAN